MVGKDLMCPLTFFLEASEILFFGASFLTPTFCYVPAVELARADLINFSFLSRVFKKTSLHTLTLVSFIVRLYASVFIPHPPEMIENVSPLFFADMSAALPSFLHVVQYFSFTTLSCTTLFCLGLFAFFSLFSPLTHHCLPLWGYHWGLAPVSHP